MSAAAPPVWPISCKSSTGPCFAPARYAVTRGTWGAYPGNSIRDIGSGNCFVHNTLLFDHPEKTVVTLPWRMAIYPPWMPDNR